MVSILPHFAENKFSMKTRSSFALNNNSGFTSCVSTPDPLATSLGVLSF